jgi:hypothetical protein
MARSDIGSAGGAELGTDDAVVVRGHPGELGRGQPPRVEPFEVCVGRPTGDGTTLSDVNRNVVLAKLCEELARGWDADALDAVGSRA